MSVKNRLSAAIRSGVGASLRNALTGELRTLATEADTESGTLEADADTLEADAQAAVDAGDMPEARAQALQKRVQKRAGKFREKAESVACGAHLLTLAADAIDDGADISALTDALLAVTAGKDDMPTPEGVSQAAWDTLLASVPASSRGRSAARSYALQIRHVSGTLAEFMG